ncbi:MAG: nucleoside triphosphate pyrophosphohydrolase [Ruminococcaceae bacterium]|jgi:tetrapyrrole methylase family protein/MazG family protein|nr:nucleoside triphosphate pyrophosphohydrolase [Oscillospiraceae bacterium]
MIDFKSKEKYDFQDLLRVMDILRGEGGCPWDREQTHESIRKNFIEEVYEACEAIDLKDNTLLCEELGDVLLQVVYHTDIAEDEGAFTMADVCDGVTRKMVLRHPHIFGDAVANTSSEVLDVWEDVKRREKGQETYADTIRAVARSLPALAYAQKVQKKAAKAGFDWPDVSGAFDKLSEETDELKRAMNGDGDKTEELGDLLFAAVNIARFLDIDAEEALERASKKFVRRFIAMEEASDRDLRTMSLAELEALWEQVKHTV